MSIRNLAARRKVQALYSGLQILFGGVGESLGVGFLCEGIGHKSL